MSEQSELELIDLDPPYRLGKTSLARWWRNPRDKRPGDITSTEWLAPYTAQACEHVLKEHALLVGNYTSYTARFQREEIGAIRLEPSLPVSAEDREFLAEQRYSTQLMAALRTAQLVLREKEDLLRSNHTLTESILHLTATGHLLTSCLAAKNDARVCLHEHYSGTVSEILGEQVVVVYEADDGEPIKQVYERKQFIAGHEPRRGDELCAYVFITQHSPGRSLTEQSTPEIPEPDFSGFDEGVTGDVQI